MRKLYCASCGDVKPTPADDAALGFFPRRVSGETIHDLVCDGCGLLIVKGSKAVAESVPKDMAEWETQFLRLQPPPEAKPVQVGELLPCPFCGSPKITIEWERCEPLTMTDTNRRWFAECSQCCCQGPFCQKEPQVISAWNRRAAKPNPGSVAASGAAADLNGLLSSVKALAEPDYHKLNVHAGRNDRLLHAVLCAYAKHDLGCEGIGWNQLSDILHSAICNEIGDDAYVAWGERIKEDPDAH